MSNKIVIGHVEDVRGIDGDKGTGSWAHRQCIGQCNCFRVMQCQQAAEWNTFIEEWRASNYETKFDS